MNALEANKRAHKGRKEKRRKHRWSYLYFRTRGRIRRASKRGEFEITAYCGSSADYSKVKSFSEFLRDKGYTVSGMRYSDTFYEYSIEVSWKKVSINVE
jgi:hypothetical protein